MAKHKAKLAHASAKPILRSDGGGAPLGDRGGRAAGRQTKLRSGGKQQVEVRYVYANGPAAIGDNAQAVFGTLNGVRDRGKPPQPRVAGPALAPGAAVRSEDAAGHVLSSTSHARQEALPAPRRQKPRRPERQGERAIRARPANAGTEGGPRARPQDAGDAEG